MQQIDNLKIRIKFLLIPILAMACLAVLALVYTEVYHKQTTYLKAASGDYIEKGATVADLFASLTQHHTETINLMLDINHGTTEGQFYEKGIKLLDKLRLLQKTFASISKKANLSDAEAESLGKFVTKVDNYVSAVSTSIEMATVDLDNSRASLTRANSFYTEAFVAHNQYNAILQQQANTKFTALSSLTEKQYTLFIAISGAMIAMLITLSIMLAKLVKSS